MGISRNLLKGRSFEKNSLIYGIYNFYLAYKYWLIGIVVQDIAIGAEDITGPVKSVTVSPTARHRCDVSSQLCYPMPRLYAAEMGHATCFGVIWRVQ